MPSTSTRGRKRTYGSTAEREEAKNARRRQSRRVKQALERDAQFHSAFPPASTPALNLPNLSQPENRAANPSKSQPLAHHDNGFLPIQFDDDFGHLLSPSPPRSPSLGSASMDISEISEPEPEELNVPAPAIEEEDAGFLDIDELVPDPEAGDQSALEKLSIRLADQLIQFQGCCHDCHDQFNREHADEHETHCSLQTFLSESVDRALSGYPDVLSSSQIARHEDDLAGSMTAAQKRLMFSGIHPDDAEEIPEHICLQAGDTPCQTARVTFDVDSITGYATSLGIAKGGIRWNPMQMPVSDLQSGLHLARRRVHYFDSHGHAHSVLRPAHELPHYTLGRLVDFPDVSLYLLFPRLYREGQQTSRLLDNDFEVWMDRILLPAIYQHCESSQTQHYPSTYQHGKCNSTARGVEGRSRKIDALPREQLLMHFVQPDPLHSIWETILQTVEEPGLQQFKGVTILLHAKNLKSLTKDPTWAGMMTRLLKYWGSIVDDVYASADFFYDIGKETCPRQTYLSSQGPGNLPPAEVLLWKKCCLDNYYAWCRDGESSSLCRQALYPTAMLRDTVSMGVEPGVNSWLRAAGLLYSQFYSSMKEAFAAGNQYPFTNAAIETLALDPQLRKTWQHVGAGLSHDPIALIKAYLYAKARCHKGIQGSLQKSFGVREEHRVSAALLDAIDCRFRTMNLHQQRIPPAGSELPYVTHPTATVLSWSRWNINKFCLGFEMVYSLSQTRWVTWEHTRMMLMFLRCLRFSYGHGSMKESAGCWRDVRYAASSDEPDGFRRTEGLGFEVTMAQYGYPWFLEKVDWETMTFKAPHGQYMLFNNPSMQQAYHARYGQIRDVRQDFIGVNKVQQLMQQFEGIPECQNFLEGVLWQMCLCAFRKDVFQHIKLLLKKECVEDALAGRVPLTWPSVNRVLRPQHRPAHLVTGKRLAVQSPDVLFSWLWEWRGDQFQRKHWSEKPYRLLYQRGFEAIQQMRGKRPARAWKQKLKSLLIRSHWLLPYPQGDRFMKRQGEQLCWWSSYHPGVHAFYQNQEGVEILTQPFPASDIHHYPLDGWELSHTSTQYMPYDIEPEHDLSDLTENEVYEQVSQLAVERQLVGEVGIPNSGPGLGADATDIEVYSFDASYLDKARSVRQVGRMQMELKREERKLQTLQYRPRRRRLWDESEEESASDLTSDEERLDLCVQRQGRVVAKKTEELQRLRAQEAESKRRQTQLIEEQQRAQRRAAEAAAERVRKLERKQRWRLMRERFEERLQGLEAHEAGYIRNLGGQGRFGTSVGTRRRESTDCEGVGRSSGGRVQESRVVLGELNVRAVLRKDRRALNV
jgi:hypothetical protein